MSDEEPTTVETPQETSPAVETTPEPVTTITETPAPETAKSEVVPAAPTLEEQLAALPGKEFRRLLHTNPHLAGVFGRELHEAKEAERLRQEEDNARKVREQTEVELLKFAEDNAEYMKEHYPQAYQRLQEIQTERKRTTDEALTSEIRGQTSHAMAMAIGQAIKGIPEWGELTPADHQKLAEELVGKPDNEVFSVFNRRAVELIAERRAKRLHNDWKTKDLTAELAKEREAIRQEEAAKLLKNSDAPDIGKPKGAPASGPAIRGMSDSEFQDWWKSRYG